MDGCQCSGAFEDWSARDELHVQGCLSLSQVGLLFPVNHAPLKVASLTGFAPVISCMRGRRVVMDYTTGTEMVSPAGISPATWSLGHSRSMR